MTTTPAPVNVRINARAAAVHLSTRDEAGRIDFPLCGAPGNTPRAYAAFRPVVVTDAPTCKRCLKIGALAAAVVTPAAAAPAPVAAAPARRLRTVKVDDATWVAAQVTADANGESVSDVIRRALTDYAAAAPVEPTGYAAQICRRDGAAWTTVGTAYTADHAAALLNVPMQRAGMRFSELLDLQDDLAAGHVLWAESGVRFRVCLTPDPA
jgi:hypothetical protein